MRRRSSSVGCRQRRGNLRMEKVLLPDGKLSFAAGSLMQASASLANGRRKALRDVTSTANAPSSTTTR
jgi:hypothetical protein